MLYKWPKLHPCLQKDGSVSQKETMKKNDKKFELVALRKKGIAKFGRKNEAIFRT